MKKGFTKAIVIFALLITSCEGKCIDKKIKSIQVSCFEAYKNEDTGELEKAGRDVDIYEIEEREHINPFDKIFPLADWMNINNYRYDELYYDEILYNEAGKLIETVAYDKYGEPSSRQLLKYDDKGNWISYENYTWHAEVLSEKQIAKYDEEGNRVLETHYDADGNMTLEITYKRSNNDKSKRNIIMTTQQGGSSDWYCLYDEKGNMLKFVFSEAIQHEFKYNKANLLTEENYYYHGVLTSKRNYEYDTNGNLLKKVRYNKDNVEKRRQLYEYDKHDNVVKYTLLEPNEQKIECSYAYVYDDYGNWIQRIDTKHEGSVVEYVIVEKIIKYFEEK